MTGVAGPARFVYDPQLANYQLAEEHPFKPVRLELTRSLLHACGLLTPAEETPPRDLPAGALELVHDRDYIEAVRTLSAGRHHPSPGRYGLGTGDNPIFPAMHEQISRVCAATLTAVELVAGGQALRAANLAGGLHHAQRAQASGFCVYNDLAIAIEYAVKEYGLRVAYLDIDAHHGDGVQWHFYERAEVMTISLHESGRYLFPGTGHSYELGKGAGRGLSVNVPLEPFTDDAGFLEAFEAVVPRALEAFAPDLLVVQAGADMHRYDPLAHLDLSLQGMARCYELICEYAERFCGGRLVATGGGGYDPYRTVPRAWAQLWAVMTGRRLPATLPASWREPWQRQLGVALPESPDDALESWPRNERQAARNDHNRAVVARLLGELERIWRERGLPVS